MNERMSQKCRMTPKIHPIVAGATTFCPFVQAPILIYLCCRYVLISDKQKFKPDVYKCIQLRLLGLCLYDTSCLI